MARLVVVLALLVAACSSPTAKLPKVDDALAAQERINQEVILRQISDEGVLRVGPVLGELLQKNVELCPTNREFSTGLMWTWNYDANDPKQRLVARSSGYGPGLFVRKVYSPSEALDLRPGDQIVAVNSRPITLDRESGAYFTALMQAATKNGSSVLLRTMRDNTRRDIVVTSAPRCPGFTIVESSNKVNALADGTNVHITTAMLDFLKTDDELALVLGHEFAHNLEGHIRAQSGNYRIGMLLGFIVTMFTGADATKAGAELGRQLFSQDFEAEADYVGTYLAARAGYDVKKAAELWRRFGALHPEAIHANPLASHPDTAKRFLLIQQAADEIEAKKAKGEPLVPNLKRDITASK